MAAERDRILAGVIALHKGEQVFGRTRLQKTIKLLQRLGLPTDYAYMLHFYGPYSEELQAEAAMIEEMGLITTEQRMGKEGEPYYVIRANKNPAARDVEPFRQAVQMLESANTTELELAATYDAFRESGCSHEDALRRLRSKKGSKSTPENENRAFVLLEKLGVRY